MGSVEGKTFTSFNIQFYGREARLLHKVEWFISVCRNIYSYLNHSPAAKRKVLGKLGWVHTNTKLFNVV